MHKRTALVRLVLTALILTALPLAGAADQAQAPKLVDSCPGGQLYQLGEQRLLVLSGTPYDMGFAHGRLLKKEARINADTILAFVRASDLVRAKSLFAGTIKKAYARLEPFIPARYQEEMRGVADGAGAPLEDVRLTNIFPALFHCTGFAFMGKATRDGTLLHGRILDYMTMLGLQARAVTILARPKGFHTYVNVSYAGFIGSVTGMNDEQVAIGEMGGGGRGKWDGMPMPMLLRKALEEAGTLDQAVDVFRKTPRTCEYYYVISDGKTRDARGLYCTPTEFQTVKPGQKHPQLAEVVPDVVILSGTDRLKALAKRVRENYGKIDAAMAIRMMTRPVSMKENLHTVLFAPTSLEMWVAHAGRVDQPNYQACYQKYQHYDLRELMKLFPAPGSPVSQPVRQQGRVPASVFRPLAECDDPALAKLVRSFEVKPASFPWRMQWWYDQEDFAAHAVTFPSPLQSPLECNNTVYCEYYVSRKPGRRPGVIVLHILDGRFRVARVVCTRLAAEGVHALLVKMPYYGPRRPEDRAQMEKLADDPATVVAALRQAIMDVRRAARWLSTRAEVDPQRIGICGVSLGGFCAATSAGVDGLFPRVAIILAGGDVLKVIQNRSREVRSVQEAIARKGLSPQQLREMLAPVDPLTYASRLRGSDVLMINAREDQIVPAACAEGLARASGAQIKWYPGNHYSMALFVPAVLARVIGHFSAEDWSGQKHDVADPRAAAAKGKGDR